LTGKIFSSSKCIAADALTNTDLVAINEQGISCWARINLDGALVKFNPPQTMIAAPLKKGARWDFKWKRRRNESASALRRHCREGH